MQGIAAALALVFVAWSGFALYKTKPEQEPDKPDATEPAAASIAHYLGSKLYSQDGNRYGGEVVDIDSNHASLGAAIQVEWFNGKREWLSLQAARQQWAFKWPPNFQRQ